jgi:hypothetical protein
MTDTSKAFARASIICAVLAGISTASADWRIEPALRLGYEYDDNAILDFRTDEETQIDGYIVEGIARFAYDSQLTDFFATPRVRYRDYGNPDFDSTDMFFNFSLDRDLQFSNFGIRGSYADELVRTAERADADLELEDPDQVPEDDTARVFLRDTRQRVEVVPYWSYRMSNVSRLGLDASYLDVAYDEGLLGLLNDYTNIRTNITYRRDWSPRNTAILTGTFRQYKPDGRESISAYGISGGVENRFSEKTVFRATVGVENTELDTGEDVVEPVANISIVRRLETITMFAQYRRVISGGGGGSLTARDMINLNFSRRLNDRITAGIGVRAYTTTALEEGTFTIDERDYLQLRGQFIWNLSRTFALEANYRYTILNRELLGEAANSNNIMVFLNWRPNAVGR